MAQDTKFRSSTRPPTRPPTRHDSIVSGLRVKLEDESQVLDTLVSTMSRGQTAPEVWSLLHEAAVRDGRVTNLLSAYERLTQDRKLKFLTTALQCEVLMHAAMFASDVAGDPGHAVGYLEQVLVLAPNHAEAFSKIEAVLTQMGNGLKLADVYASAAAHRADKDEQLALLLRAAELADGFSEEHERVIKIYQHILRIDPSDARIRRSLEERLRAAGKFRELGRLLEQALGAEEISGEEALKIRERLVALYAGDLVEPDRALPHIEEILRGTPGHEQARGAAHRLVQHKSFGGRAAAALADAYARLETYPESAAMLEISLETLRGPKRAEVQKRLGLLRYDKLGDAAGAYPLLEAVVALDPADEDVRARFRDLANVLGKQLEAARLLARAANGVRDVELKALLGAEVGDIYLAAREFKQARSAFAGVIDAGAPEGPSVLHAARALAELHAEAKEPKPLAQTLELLARIEPDVSARQEATRRLALLAENELDKSAVAIEAWRSLLGTPLHERALEALDRLYDAADLHEERIDVLEKRVMLAKGTDEARAFAQRAVELRATHAKTKSEAVGAWMEFLRKYGPSRAAHAKLIPLLEQEKKWTELAALLGEDLALAEERERASVLVRLAQVKWLRQDDPAAAFDLYEQAFALDPSDQGAKLGLEKFLELPALRLRAAELLEPVYRAETATSALLRVLEVKAEAAPDVASRLALLDESVVLAERDLRDPRRALALAGAAVAVAFESDLAGLAGRLDITDRLVQASGDRTLHATLLVQALGEKLIDHAARAELARRAGAALAAAGDPDAALSIYRRALAFEPSSPELLARIDRLLAEGGKPEERMVLYRSALAQEKDPARRRELYHSIATIERRDLKNVRAAIATWRRALTEDPKDGTARAALVEAYEAEEDWSALYDELALGLPDAVGEPRALLLARLASVAEKRGNALHALEHYRELIEGASPSEAVLSSAGALAESTGDYATLARVLEHRMARAVNHEDACGVLEKLGSVFADHLGDAPRGASAYKRAAALAETSLADEPRAEALLERVLAVTPADQESAEHLVKLYLRGGRLAKLPHVVEGLVKRETDDAEAARRLLEFEPYAVASGGVGTWLSLSERLLSNGAQQGELAFARARVLASDPARLDQAAAQFRELITAARGQGGRLVDAFDALLASSPPSERKDDRRFLFAWKADHAPEGQRTAILFAWAHAEEVDFGDPQAAVGVYQRVLAAEPTRGDALEATVRLLRQMRDMPAALTALIALRDSSEGALRRERDLEIASLLLTELDRPEEAIDRVAPLIEAGPADAGALGIVYRALEHTRGQQKAAALLERAATLAEDEAQSLLILKTLLAMPQVPALADARRRWFESLLDHYESEPQIALETALSAVTEMPADEALWARAEKLARSIEQPALVADAYRRVLDQPLDPELGASIGRRAVDYREEWFDDPEAVILLLRRILEMAPRAAWVRDRLKLAYGSGERWQELFALYDDAIERALDDAERIELLTEAAQAAKDFATWADRAIGYFERLLKFRPGDRRVVTSLERLYEKQGKIQPLIDLLSVELVTLTGEQAQSMRLRIAGLWLRDARYDGAAFKLIEDVLREDSGRAQAFALLEAIVFRSPSDEVQTGSSAGPEGAHADAAESAGDGVGGSIPPGSTGEESPSVPPPALWAGKVGAPSKGKRSKKRVFSVQERAAVLLKERYLAQAKHVDLGRVLDVELGLAPGPKERARKHEELLALHLDTLHDDRTAFSHAAALVALEPRVVNHRSTLTDLAERLSAWERLGDVLVETAASANDPLLSASLLVEAAVVYRDRVLRDVRAVELFFAALAASADDRGVALATARELDALLARGGRAEERCGVLEKIVLLESEPERKREALHALASEALGKVGDPDRAIRAWRSYIDGAASEIEAWDGLITVLRRAERWSDLESALAKHAEMADVVRARADLVEIARMQSDKLSAPQKAIETWLDIRTRFGVGDDTFTALGRLYAGLSRWDDLARLGLDEARVLAGEPTVPGAELRLLEQKRNAELAVGRVLDRTLAIEISSKLFDVCVACWVPPLSNRDATSRHGAWIEASLWALETLIRMALEDHDFEAAVGHMLAGSRYVFDYERSRQMRRQAAVVCAEQLADRERAVGIYRALLDEDDQDNVADAAVPELARLFTDLGDFADLTELWEKQALRHQGSALAAELFGKAAELAETKLSDTARALADYRKSAEAGGQNALRELARLYTNAGEHRRAAEALERISPARSPDQFAADTLRLAAAYLAGGERERALERLEKAVEEGAEPRAIRARLGEFYREERDFTKLAELLRIEAEEAADKSTKLELLRQAAHLHLDQRGDPLAAIPLLDQARRLTVDDSSISLALTRALVLVSRFEEARDVLRSELEHYGQRKPKDRAIIHFELARVLLRLDGRPAALVELDLASKIDPGHPGILCMLGKLSAEEGQLDRAQRTLRALLLVLGRTAPGTRVEVSRGEVLFELALIAQKENAADRAEELIESALHASSENPEEAESFEKALRQRGSFELVARSLEMRLAASPMAATRAGILRDLVLLYEQTEKLDREKARLADQADVALRELREHPSSAPLAFRALEVVYDRTGQDERLGEVLALRVAAGYEGDATEYADALYRLARIRLSRPATVGEGTSLLERAIELVPHADHAAETLALALEVDPKSERVARLFERSTRGRGREAAHARALQRLVELGAATPEESRDAIRLALQASDEERARAMLGQLLARDHVEPEIASFARRTLADLATKGGDLRLAADLNEQEAEFVVGHERRELLLSVAETAKGALRDLPRAARIYAKLRDSEPADREIWEPLLEIYRALGDAENLVALIGETLPLIDSSDERSRLRLEQVHVLLLARGAEEQAIDLLGDLLDEDPNHADAASLLANVLERIGAKERLTALLARQLDTAKDEGNVPSVIALSLRLGTLLEEAGRVPEALDIYHASLDWDPREPGALAAIARLSEQRGDPFEIADALERLLDVSTGPEAASLAQRIYDLRIEQGDSHLAERALELGLAADPDNTTFSDLLMQLYRARGAHRELVVLLRKAFDRSPESAALLFELLDGYRNSGELGAAVDAVSIALEKAPGLAPLYRERARLHEALGHSADAVADFERAYTLGGVAHLPDYVEALEREAKYLTPPQDRPLRLRLAQMLVQAGLVDAARDQLNLLREQDPRDQEVLFLLAEIDYREGRWSDASAAYAELAPFLEGEDLVAVALKFANASEEAGSPGDAKSALERAFHVSPDNDEVRVRLRMLYESTGEGGALGHLIIEEAAKESDAAGRGALLMRAGELLLGPEGDPAEAIRILEEARALRPEDDACTLLLGRAYVAAGRAPEGLVLYRSTLEQRKGRKSKQLSELHREMSRLSLQQGDLSPALESLTRAFEMDLQNGDLALELGQLAVDLDDAELAGRAFRSITFMKTAHHPGEGATPAAKGIAYFFLGRMAKESGDGRKARLLAQKALIEDPNLEPAKQLLEDLK